MIADGVSALAGNDYSVVALALQVILGLVQLLTFVLVKRVHSQTSLRPPPLAGWPSIEFKGSKPDELGDDDKTPRERPKS